MNYQNQYLCSKFFIRSLVLLACLALALPVMAGWTQRQKITSTPRGVVAQFGNAVAINGNTMVVGARFDSTTASQAGAAYVYVLNGSTWTQQAVLLANDGANDDKFGYSVAISEDTIVVGAYQDDSPLSNGGSAYVFVRNGTTWSFQQKLTSSDGVADDEFGNAVGITGEVIVVGSHFVNILGTSDAGSAYIFRRTGTTWTRVQKLLPTAGAFGVFGNYFGESVAVSGNNIVVGATGDNTPETAAGAVYVFVEGVGGSYVLQQKITIPNGTNGDIFGCSVAIEGNTLVGGAREDTPIIGQPAFGAAYVFEFNGATWTSQGKIVASDGASNDRFGWSVTVSNNVVAVGARGDDTVVGEDAGSAYIFTRSGAVWTQQQKITPSDAFNGDRFGSGIALSFGNLVVGAAEKALSSPNGQGAAYYFTVDGELIFFNYTFETRILELPVVTVGGQRFSARLRSEQVGNEFQFVLEEVATTQETSEDAALFSFDTGVLTTPKVEILQNNAIVDEVSAKMTLIDGSNPMRFLLTEVNTSAQ